MDLTAPTFQVASVTGNMLVLTYDENLDATSTPATSAFAVTAGPSGSLVPVALAASGAVTVSGRTVTLKLANPVSAAHGVKVVYTVPTAPNAAKLQDALGNGGPDGHDGAPVSLQVGVAIAAMSPSGGADIDEYGAPGLPSGLY